MELRRNNRVEDDRTECERTDGIQPQVLNETRHDSLPEPTVPLPWKNHQYRRRYDQEPPDQTERAGLPHGRGVDDKRSAEDNAKDLFRKVGAYGAGEASNETLGHDWPSQHKQRDADKKQSANDNDYL